MRKKWLEARWGKHYEREKKALIDLNSKYGTNDILNESLSVSDGNRVKSGTRIIDALRMALQSEKTQLLADCDLEFEEGDSGEVTLVIRGNRRNARRFVNVRQQQTLRTASWR